MISCSDNCIFTKFSRCKGTEFGALDLRQNNYLTYFVLQKLAGIEIILGVVG